MYFGKTEAFIKWYVNTTAPQDRGQAVRAFYEVVCEYHEIQTVCLLAINKTEALLQFQIWCLFSTLTLDQTCMAYQTLSPAIQRMIGMLLINAHLVCSASSSERRLQTSSILDDFVIGFFISALLEAALRRWCSRANSVTRKRAIRVTVLQYRPGLDVRENQAVDEETTPKKQDNQKGHTYFKAKGKTKKKKRRAQDGCADQDAESPLHVILHPKRVARQRQDACKECRKSAAISEGFTHDSTDLAESSSTALTASPPDHSNNVNQSLMDKDTVSSLTQLQVVGTPVSNLSTAWEQWRCFVAGAKEASRLFQGALSCIRTLKLTQTCAKWRCEAAKAKRQTKIIAARIAMTPTNYKRSLLGGHGVLPLPRVVAETLEGVCMASEQKKTDVSRLPFHLMVLHLHLAGLSDEPSTATLDLSPIEAHEHRASSHSEVHRQTALSNVGQREHKHGLRVARNPVASGGATQAWGGNAIPQVMADLDGQRCPTPSFTSKCQAPISPPGLWMSKVKSEATQGAQEPPCWTPWQSSFLVHLQPTPACLA